MTAIHTSYTHINHNLLHFSFLAGFQNKRVKCRIQVSARSQFQSSSIWLSENTNGIGNRLYIICFSRWITNLTITPFIRKPAFSAGLTVLEFLSPFFFPSFFATPNAPASISSLWLFMPQNTQVPALKTVASIYDATYVFAAIPEPAIKHTPFPAPQ